MRRERLKLFDVDDAQLSKPHGPVGIYLGSKTPAEIAISILAEMTAVRNGVMLPAELRVAHAKGRPYHWPTRLESRLNPLNGGPSGRTPNCTNGAVKGSLGWVSCPSGGQINSSCIDHNARVHLDTIPHRRTQTI